MTGPLLIPLRGATPVVEPGAWLAPTVVLVGQVTVRAGASIWFGSVLRAEAGTIEVGPDANIQDNSVLHTDDGLALRVGRNTSVGHGVVLHGCVVGDDVVVGMGSRVLNRAVIGSESLLAAGAVVLEGRETPARSLLAGVPAKVRGELDDDQVESLRENGRIYQLLRDEYRSSGSGEA
ncbi:gamma carbonic anhydrase family protein [Nocardioides sediminis]|uniref:gamma carbonic anhydrase family protein n=1 Tax=Nocardioides sediminis TaxID=433648 RepID=UPI000D31611F|nr:gamma carbonic anhydrase family protein [Nocardioides sediminis]